LRRPAAYISLLLLLVVCCRKPDHRPEQLRGALASLRSAVADYQKKHGRNPHALSDLIRDGELRAIPVDPVTGSSSTWRTTTRETVRVDDFTIGAAPAENGEIVAIHSGAAGTDPSGKPWSDY
jgi:general secretion pathway protein G